MLRVFIGYDPRQPLAYNVLQHSIVSNSSKPVQVTPLILRQLPIKRRGLTEFTYSRFLVPYLCDFKGKALFMDADMVVTGDIAELFDSDDMNAVSVMQDQQRFEWASVMMFQCSACRQLTPEYIDDEKNKLYDLAWAPYVGELPKEWNHCVGYAEPRDDAKLYHYTQGIPAFYETADAEPGPWLQAHRAATHTVPWRDLMGKSVHAGPVLNRLIGRYVNE